MSPYADDLATLGETLDQDNAIHVGHSTGGDEVALYIRRHGTKRVAKAVLIGGVPPLIRKTTANPGGLPTEAFDQIRTAVLADCSQFSKGLGVPFYGANQPGTKISQGLRDSIWVPGMLAGHKDVYRLHQGFLRDGLHGRPQEVRRATLILHGDHDQIVPIRASALCRPRSLRDGGRLVFSSRRVFLDD